jgi:hypothetical protein
MIGYLQFCEYRIAFSSFFVIFFCLLELHHGLLFSPVLGGQAALLFRLQGTICICLKFTYEDVMLITVGMMALFNWWKEGLCREKSVPNKHKASNVNH